MSEEILFTSTITIAVGGTLLVLAVVFPWIIRDMYRREKERQRFLREIKEYNTALTLNKNGGN